MIRPAIAFVTLLLLTAAALAAPPGARGVVLTTVEGTRIEEIPLTFLGTQENALGPGYDLHLVRLEGEIADRVGVAAGMSGSPVYVDGELIGALAYRFGLMPKEAVGGVTPLADIVAAGKSPAPSRADADSLASPIGTPVQIGGLAGPVREWLAPQLRELGFVPLAGGGSASASGTPHTLRPGSPVGVELVRGDLAMGATGTVTLVDGDRVYAFGHSFFGDGRVEMPMISADVIHTLADTSGSFKMARFGPVVGAVTDDRLTAVVGRTGQVARTVPLKLRVHGADYGEREFEFELARHAALTPLLSGVVVANALIADLGHDRESTMLARGRVRLADRPDLEIEMAFAGEGAPDPGLALAGTLQQTVGYLWSNPFAPVEVEGIELQVQVDPQAHRYTIESLHYDRGPVRPGATVELDCVLRERRGERVTRRLQVTIPDDIVRKETLALAVGPPAQTQRALGRRLEERLKSAPDLDTLIETLGERRSAHRLTVVLARRAESVILRGAEYDQLPPTAARLLGTKSATGGGKKSTVSLLGRDEVALDGPVSGGLAIRLEVDPGLGAGEENP